MVHRGQRLSTAQGDLQLREDQAQERQGRGVHRPVILGDLKSCSLNEGMGQGLERTISTK